MLVKKSWTIHKPFELRSIKYEGWFLFGFIPLYIIETNVEV